MKKKRQPDTAASEMTVSPRFTLAVALVATSACIKTFDLDGAESGSTSTGDPADPTTTSVGSSMSSTTATPEDTSTSAAPDDTTGIEPSTSTGEPPDDESSTGEPASVCDPQPQIFDSAIRLPWPDAENEEILVDASCTVTAIEQPEPTQGLLRLLCAEQGGNVQRDIEIYGDPYVAPPLAVDQTVRLLAAHTIFIDSPGWLYVAVRNEADELVLGTYDFRNQPDDVDVTPWFSPFTITLDTDVCPEEEKDVVEPGTFIVDLCPTHVERAAAALTSPWGDALVLDQTMGTLGPYAVRVPYAWTVIPNADNDESCNDQPFVAGSAVMIRSRE